MLEEISISNYKSIKDKLTVCFPPQKEETSNIFSIYGINAAGKTNILAAINCIKEIIVNSNNYQLNEEFPIETFIFDESYNDKPSSFEFIFSNNNAKFKYNISLTRTKVINESLIYYSKNKEKTVFERFENNIKIGSDFISANKKDKIRIKIYVEEISENILFLSLANRVNIQYLKDVFMWFEQCLNIFIDNGNKTNETSEKIVSGIINKDVILKYLKFIDNNIVDIKINKNNNDLEHLYYEDNVNQESYNITLSKKNDENKIQEFNLEDEADGIKHFYNLSPYIIKTLESGSILCIDDLEDNFHTLLSKEIIKLFNSEYNNKNAQLIFTTKDCNINNNCICVIEKAENSVSFVQTMTIA